MSNEQDRYAVIQGSEPIPVPMAGPFVASTPNVTDPPPPAVAATYNAAIRKSLKEREG
jgi:hypothetical protein